MLHAARCKYRTQKSRQKSPSGFYLSLWSPYVIGQTIIFLPCDFYLSSFLWSPYVIGQTIIFLPCSFFLLLLSSSIFFFFPRLISAAVGCLPYFYTWHGPSTNLECRSERCCTWLAANAGPKKVAKNHHLGTISQICGAISSQLRHVSTIEKKLVNQQLTTENLNKRL